MKKHERIYLITDGCVWEINKQLGSEHPHAMEVVDIETGAVRYIKSGSKIRFVEGEISDIRTQKAYEVSNNGQSGSHRTRSKEEGKPIKNPRL